MGKKNHSEELKIVGSGDQEKEMERSLRLEDDVS